MKRTIGNLAVIGPIDEVLPYVGLGAAVCITADADEARKALVGFAEKGHPVILVSGDLFGTLGDTVDAVTENWLTAISALPGKKVGGSVAEDRIRTLVSRAIGFHVTL